MQSGNRVSMTADTLPKQHGWECQITALSGVMNWLFACGLLAEKPVASRKRYDKNAKTSLRQIAKKHFHSTVGELNSVYDLVKLAKLNPEITASYITCDDPYNYFQTLIEAVDHNLAPIVFFEGSGWGQPIIDTHDNDHAAVVLGYHYDEENHLKFTIAQWRKEYEVDAFSLFVSSDQKRTTGFTFFHKTYENGKAPEKAAWIPEQYVDNYYKDPVILKKRKATHDILKGFYANSIVIVDSMRRFNEFLDKVNRKIADLSGDKSDVAQSKFKSLTNLKTSLENNKEHETVFKIMQKWRSEQAAVDQSIAKSCLCLKL